MSTSPKAQARHFALVLSDGRIARIPAEVVEQHIDPSATAAHVLPREPNAEPEDANDVSQHSLSVDPASGISDWHVDYELGECQYIDEAGFSHALICWHNHPLGTEYAEIYVKS